MRQVLTEPNKETQLLTRLRKRADTNARFRAFVDELRQLTIDGLVSPRWLLDAAKLVHAGEVWRLYKISQAMPKPGPRPQLGGEPQCRQ